jgi:tape measure domain-containing protein
MAFQIKYVYDLVDKISPQLQKINGSLQKTQSKAAKVATAAGRSFDKMKEKLHKVGRSATDLGKSLSLRLTAPIGLMGGLALRSAAKLETLETAFVGILGSADEAKKIVGELFEFTAKTPFQLEGVAASAKQLLAAGVASKEITDRLQMLGDISAAANVPLQDMSSIFAKIKNKGKAMTEEILQMSDRGIPIIKILAKQFGVVEGQIFDMASKGKISFNDISKAMRNMTKEGGFANKAMILQSKTLGGVLSTLKDNVNLSLGSIGKTFLPEAKEVANKLIDIAQKVRVFAEENKGLVKTLLTIGGVLAVVAPVLIVIGQMALGLKALAVAFGMAKAAALLFNTALLANPIGLIVTAIASAIGLFVLFREEINETISSIKEFFINLNPLKNIGNTFSNLKNSMFGGNEEISAAVSTDINKKSEFSGALDVNLNNLPAGSNAQLKTEGAPNFNVGVNSIFTGAAQ